MEIWSVVHFPKALINSLAPWIFDPIGSKGSSNCKRSDEGLTDMVIPLPSSIGS